MFMPNLNKTRYIIKTHSGAFASEFLENLNEMFPLVLVIVLVVNYSKNNNINRIVPQCWGHVAEEYCLLVLSTCIMSSRFKNTFEVIATEF